MQNPLKTGSYTATKSANLTRFPAKIPPKAAARPLTHSTPQLTHSQITRVTQITAPKPPNTSHSTTWVEGRQAGFEIRAQSAAFHMKTQALVIATRSIESLDERLCGGGLQAG